MPEIKPDLNMARDIRSAIRAELNLCYACGSCASECPVNRETDKLQPVKIVRMAGLGLFSELLDSPEIWYCLYCNRCASVCPMSVKQPVLLSFIRKESEARGRAVRETGIGVKEVVRKFHRVRWHAAARLKKGVRVLDVSGFWDEASATPVPSPNGNSGPLVYPSADAARFRKSFLGHLGHSTNVMSCFTCWECTNTCPVAGERGVFDPLHLFRMVNLGLREELLDSPSIWLCLDCRSCAAACGQLVRGNMLMQRAQELAVRDGFVNGFFVDNWGEVRKKLFTEYIKRVDMVLRETGFAEFGVRKQSGSELGDSVYEIVHKKPLWCSTDARFGPAL